MVEAAAFPFPAEHAFPPFYTLQLNPDTARVQVEMWGRLVLQYCAAQSRFLLQADGVWERTSPLFCNRAIDRALTPTMIRIVLAHLVDEGHALYHPPLPKGVHPPRVGAIEADRLTHAQSASAAAAAPARSGAAGSPANAVLLLWKTLDEWGDALYEWVRPLC